jgi:hypothetical protein
MFVVVSWRCIRQDGLLERFQAKSASVRRRKRDQAKYPDYTNHGWRIQVKPRGGQQVSPSSDVHT